MTRLHDVSLGDIRRATGRYRPVALTLAAILAVVALTDAPTSPGSRSPAPLATGGRGSVAGDGTAPDRDPLSGAVTETPEPVEAISGFEFFTPGGDSGFSSGDSSPSSSDDLGRGNTEPPTTSTTSRRPLVISAHGWASRGGGTPAGSAGVPGGTLPVGSRGGQLDKVTFVRLSGDQGTLVLSEDPAGRRLLVGSAGLQACRSRGTGWKEGGNQDLAAAPAWFADTCVKGTAAPDGRWSFPVGQIGDPADPRGFVIVPAPDAPADFQITFTAPRP